METHVHEALLAVAFSWWKITFSWESTVLCATRNQQVPLRREVEGWQSKAAHPGILFGNPGNSVEPTVLIVNRLGISKVHTREVRYTLDKGSGWRIKGLLERLLSFVGSETLGLRDIKRSANILRTWVWRTEEAEQTHKAIAQWKLAYVWTLKSQSIKALHTPLDLFMCLY